LQLTAKPFDAQIGYVIAGAFQPALRYVWIGNYPVDEFAAAAQEAAVGFTWYQFGNNLKWQADFAWLRNDTGRLASGANADDLRLRLAVQAAF